MVDHVPPDMADKMIDALGANDKARALLLHYRTCGTDLETSWEVVQQMMRELGEEGDMPKKPSLDYSFREVKDYLTADRSKRWKRFLGTMAFALICCGFPGYLTMRKSARLKTSLQSLFWSSTQATVIKTRTYSTRSYHNQREVDRHYQDFRYRYQVDGIEHTEFRGRLQLPGAWDKPLKTGDRLDVFYNPDKPSQSLYARKIYQLTMTLLFNLGVVIFGVLVAVFAWSRERRWRQLHRWDQALK